MNLIQNVTLLPAGIIGATRPAVGINRSVSIGDESYNMDGFSSPYSVRVAQYGRRWYWPWLAFSAILVIGICLYPMLARNADLRGSPPILEGDVRDIIACICRAPRAVVYLDTQWSIDTVMGRRCFNEALTRISISEFPSTTFFVLDEWPMDDDKNTSREFVQSWLQSLNLKELPVGHGHGIGAGSLIWLEKGKVIHEEWSAKTLNAAGIVERTRKLWRP